MYLEQLYLFQRDHHNKTVRSYLSEAALFGPRLPDEGIAVSYDFCFIQFENSDVHLI